MIGPPMGRIVLNANGAIDCGHDADRNGQAGQVPGLVEK